VALLRRSNQTSNHIFKILLLSSFVMNFARVFPKIECWSAYERKLAVVKDCCYFSDFVLDIFYCFTFLFVHNF